MRAARWSLAAAFLSSLALPFAMPCRTEEPGPAPELSKLDVTLGNWQSSGTWRESPDAAPMPWKAVGTAEKVLGGHIVQETTRIAVAVEGAPPLVMRSITGWDATSKRFRQVALSNMGFGGEMTLDVVADGRLVSTATRLEMGRRVVEVGVAEYSKDGGSFRVERSVDGGKSYVSVEGTMKRGGDGCPADAMSAAALAPPPAELAALEKLLGAWTFKAKVSPMSGLPLMETSGRETVRSIVGGHAYHGVVLGDPMPEWPQAYRGEFYLVRDSGQGCYLSIDVDNFGAFTVSPCHLLGKDRLVYLTAASVYGELSASRAVLGWNEDGSVLEMTAHRLAGTSPAETSFEGRYVRVKE